MDSEEPQEDVTAQTFGRTPSSAPRPDPTRVSRRQAMGRISTVVAAGAVAWAVPEILTAKPAAGATLSGPVGDALSTAASTANVVPDGPDDGAKPVPASASSLAFTGLNIQRDAEVGAALVAGGWALQHWASRSPKPAGTGPSGGRGADRGSSD